MTDFNQDDATSQAQLNRTRSKSLTGSPNPNPEPDPAPVLDEGQHLQAERHESPVDRVFKAVWGKEDQEALHKKAIKYDLKSEVALRDTDPLTDTMGARAVDADLRNMTLFNSGRTEKSRRNYLSQAAKEYEEASVKLQSIKEEKEKLFVDQGRATAQADKDAVKERIMQSIAESEAAIDLLFQAKEHEYKGYKSSKEDKQNADKLKTQKATMLINLYREECKNPHLSAEDREMLMQKAQKLQVYKDTTMTRLAVMDGRLADTYDQYKELSTDDVFAMSEQSEYNTNPAYRNIVYGSFAGKNSWIGATYGYVSTPSAHLINTYMRIEARKARLLSPEERAKVEEDERKLKDEIVTDMQFMSYDEHMDSLVDPDEIYEYWKTKIATTMQHMDFATRDNVLRQDAKLYRMVDGDILNWGFGLDPDALKQMGKSGIVDALNMQAGTEFREPGYMSTGWSVDELFADRPVMLTVLADAGQRCYVTKNFREGEIVFGKNTRYVFMGAINHETDKKQLKKTRRDTPDDAKSATEMESKDDVTFSGIELIVKLVNDDAH